MAKKVAVIGAGVSGLMAIKCLKDEGLIPVCFERTGYFGGLWHYTEDIEDGQACVNQTTVINTSKEMMCFSDFPIPKEYPNFMHNRKVMDYFTMYAEKFNLLDHVRFHTEVLHVSRAEDFKTSGRWNIKIKDKKSGKVAEEVYDAVMLCTGHHAQKYMPKFPGEETFKGKILHSQEYKAAKSYEGKRVVIIGIGNSGGDAAVDLGRTCDQVFLSTRRGAWVAHRIHDYGIPFDMAVSRRIIMNIMGILPLSLIVNMQESALNKRFDHQLYGLKPKHRATAQHPTVNDDLPNRIASGSVIIKSNVSKITQTGVQFDDGTYEDNIDVIMYCTGYKFGFPFLEPGVIDVKDNVIDLYKYCFHPDLKPSTICVIGCAQPLGAIMPIAELQCRWAAQIFKGENQLPSSSAMWADIQRKKDLMSSRYVTTQRHTIQVDFVPFMDEIAEHVGCKPDMWKLLQTDPKLAWNVLMGPCTPYQFRIMGPGKWEGARQAIMTQWERCKYPLQTRDTGIDDSTGGLSFLKKVVILCVFVLFIWWIFM